MRPERPMPRFAPDAYGVAGHAGARRSARHDAVRVPYRARA